MNDPRDAQFVFATLDELIQRLIEMETVQCEMEGLSELAHGLQCADILKAAAPFDVELQVAGLVHDVAVLHSPERDHGPAGARAVSALFSARVAELVRLHVDAKRYLVATDPAYRAQLSFVSIKTLEGQGGPMTQAQIAAFAGSPFHRDAVRLRAADDRAKTPGKKTSGLDEWRPVLARLNRAHH